LDSPCSSTNAELGANDSIVPEREQIEQLQVIAGWSRSRSTWKRTAPQWQPPW
jgi:hypothetical protein